MRMGLREESPTDASRHKDRLKYYVDLAKIAERGKISCIFFADSYGVNDVYGGNTDATYRGGCQVAQLDPFMIISAMAAATETVGFAVSGNALYLNPYIFARSCATLDHLTDGRLGWNIVTGYTNASARAMGFDSIMPHDQRYEKAGEFVDVVYRLWEGSWDDDAQVWDVERNVAYDPARIKKIEFDGRFHKISATQQTHPSPQRVPVIFQAGSSKAGIALAGAHAEGLFCGSLVPSRTAAYMKDVRKAVADSGRDPKSVKSFAGLSTFIAPTLEEAQAKYEAAARHASPEAGLAKFGGYTNTDLSKYPLDEPFEFKEGSGDNIIRGIVEMFKAGDGSNEAWTPRKLGTKMALGSLYPVVVGTPAMVADFMEKWVEEADIDGFNLYAANFPESFEDVVDLLVPELQRRGVYWLNYPVPGGTFRENLYASPGQARVLDDHPAAKYRREREAARAIRDAEEKKVKVVETIREITGGVESLATKPQELVQITA
ncbi:hypothetical protein A1O1_05058 [Capronia coronata CBS 617.96]|uniref:Luciferase-like domain-containing protein n=1 Tax=Capronia coronata CBS 617.96 TaxID=1182541 RepID=W9YEN2_9EURO|nr:uncharacterized protein A1O1_05058 [Capronia coronata CBS 617.96]EXJ88130.1 hypothetical protein A1O1_05058 [Capronia coronata CBS 617.96]